MRQMGSTVSLSIVFLAFGVATGAMALVVTGAFLVLVAGLWLRVVE